MGEGEEGGLRILSVFLKKMSNSIHFSQEKASQMLTHNLSMRVKFYVKKDTYKA